jgi:hypothetical protein
MITSFHVTSTTWIQKHQVLFWILCVLLIGTGIVLGILIGVNIISTLPIVVMSCVLLHFIHETFRFFCCDFLMGFCSKGIIYILIAFGTALYFFIVGGRTIRFLKQFKKKVVSKDEVPKKVLRRVRLLSMFQFFQHHQEVF